MTSAYEGKGTVTVRTIETTPGTNWCSFCHEQYEDWIGIGLTVDTRVGSQRVCSEGCAIEVTQANEAGVPVWEGRPR